MDEKCGDDVPLAEGIPLAEVESELCTLAGQIAAATSRFLVLVGEFDRRKGWAGAGVVSCAHWLSWRCGLDLRTAREHVRVARSLADLPKVRATFAEGRLSYSKVRAIVRVATPASEGDLVEAGLNAPAATLERLTRGLATAGRNAERSAAKGVFPRGVRPDGSTPGLPRPRKPADPDRAYLQWRWDEAGRLVLWGRLDAVAGAALLAAAARAEALASPERAAPSAAAVPTDGSAEPPDQASVDCRAPRNLAGAVSVMAQTILVTQEVPTFAPAAEVTVLVGIDELQEALAESDLVADQQLASSPAGERHSPDPGRFQDGPALKRAVLRRLVDDGRLRTAVLAGDGRTLDLGRRSRRLSKPQLAVLWRRDGGCRAPGCARTRFLHAHHVRFWSRGGTSSVDNVLLLCGEHHRVLHEGGFGISALGEQRFAFHRADGTPWLAAPPVRGDVDALAADHRDVTAQTIVPQWDGRRLDLGAAVTTYLDNWASPRRQPAPAAST